MPRPLTLGGDAQPLPASGLPSCPSETCDLTTRPPTALEPKAALEAHPPGPAQPGQRRPQRGIGKAALGPQDDLATPRPPPYRRLSQLFGGLAPSWRTAMVEHTPH